MAGTEQRVAINDNVSLDFAGLFDTNTAPKIAAEPSLTDNQYKDTGEQQKPLERLTEGLEGQQAKQLYIEGQRAAQDHKRSLEVYRAYQENTKRSGQLQTEILKGIKAGEDIYSLFLKAAKAISLMTSNTVFYSQIEADTRSIYGIGLNYKPPLKDELQDTQKRLQRLLEAEQRETDTDSRERIKRAIQAHRERIAELEAQINKAN